MNHLDVAARIGAVLDGAGIPYHVGGSIASSVFGDPRATNDIDVIVHMEPWQAAPVAAALGDDFAIDTAMLEEAASRLGSANFFFLPMLVKIDVFVVADEGFDAQEMARRRWVPLGESRGFYAKSPEDTVLRKLLWYEAGGRSSERQWRDIVATLRRSLPNMDAAYLHVWANRLGVAELLGQARAEASG